MNIRSEVRKRVLSVVLVIAMLCSNASGSMMNMVVRADGIDGSEPAMIVSGGGNDYNVSHGEKAVFPYGTSVSMEMRNLPAGTIYYWVQSPGEDEPEVLDTSKAYAVGKHQVGYEFYPSGEGEDIERTFVGEFEIVKATLPAPTGLSWSDGSTANWGDVTTDSNGRSVTVDYEVSLYKDGVACYQQPVTNAEGTQIDFADKMLAEGQGAYSFTVKAKAPAGNATMVASYNDSAASAYSSDGAKVVNVSIEKGFGISTATAGESTSFLAIPDNGEKNSKTITATPLSDWLFGQWTSEDSVTFEDENSASTKVTVNADASGTLAVKAIGKESNPPTVENITVTDGKMTSAAQDTQSGLVAFAFTTQGSIEEDSTLWTSVTNTTEEQTFEKVPTESGTYYFYAKDASGNIAKSTNGVKVSKITYVDYYENNSKDAAATVYYIGEDDFDLEDLSDKVDENLHRKGYTFDGWYATEGLTGVAVSKLTENPAEDKTYYAKWTMDTIAFETEQENVTAAYSGINKSISSTVSATSGDVTYTLYRYDEEKEDWEKQDENTTGSFSVRNVSDSGKYRIDAQVVLTGDEGNETIPLEGTPFVVTINKVTVTAKATDKTITYMQDLPADLDFEYVGLVGDDVTDISGAKITAEGTPVCASYSAGDPVIEGGYPISFEGSFASENYNILTSSGVLTVEPKDVTKVENGVTVSLDETSFTYTGLAVVPTVTVKDGEVTLDSEQYEITYDSGLSEAPIAAGDHQVVVTFKKNYDGVLTVDYTIAAKTFEATTNMDGWEYGETPGTPTVINLPVGITRPDVKYYYLNGQVDEVTLTSGGTLVKPVDAGTYTVYAVIEDLDGNYAKTAAAPATFEILPREIHLIAKDATFDYDGSPHTCAEYRLEDKYGNELDEDTEVFVLSKESFRSIIVTGSITNVLLDGEGNNIGVPNVPTYVLTDATKASNYNIICENGTLKIRPQKLLTPANMRWDESTPGLATWVAITKQDLKIQYEVSLYYEDAKGDEHLITTVDTYDTEHSFADIIHNQVEENAEKSFFFKIQTIPAASLDAEGLVKNDYSTSNMSESSPFLHAVTISLTKKLCDEATIEEQVGFRNIEFTDAATAAAGKITLIPGESVSIRIEPEEGYVVDYGYEEHMYHNWKYMVHPTDISCQDYFSNSYVYNGDTLVATITVKSNLDQSLAGVKFTAGISDDGPIYRNFTKENDSDYSGVLIHAVLEDTIGLRDWSIQRLNKSVTTDESGQEVTTYTWDGTNYKHVVLPLDESGNAPKTATVDVKVTKPGIYRLAFDDIAPDAHSHHTLTSDYFTVYEVKFDKGDTDDDIHTMSPVYKLEGTDMPLPLCTFTKENYSFMNWSGANTGISKDGALYKANLSDTLVAQWSNDQYRYYVDYYYMKEDGSYPDTPDITDEFMGGAGTTVLCSDSKIQKNRTNYSLDAGHPTSITLTQNDQRLSVYYSTGQYKITYTYTAPGKTEPTVLEDDYYFGQTIVERETPSLAGYIFVGWNYVGYGAVPDTMPAQNILANGTFVPDKATYTVVYHLQELGHGTVHSEVYEADTDLAPTVVKNGMQDDVLTAYKTLPVPAGAGDIAAEEVDGFTLRGMVINNTADMGTALPGAEVLKTVSASGTISAANPLYIHYYYDRNEYPFTLEVWRDNRENLSNRIYQYEEIRQYGESIGTQTTKYADNDFYETLDGTAEGMPAFTMPPSYVFATYTDYSTGKRPDVMPAGPVTVTRDVVPAEKASYKINIYFEKDAIDSYKLMTTLNYESAAGRKIELIKAEDMPAEPEVGVDYKTFEDLKVPMNNGSYFTHVFLEGRSLESGIVSGEEELVLNVYYERIKTRINVDYYYGNATARDQRITTITLEGKWGSTYTFDPIALFDAGTSDNWVATNPTYAAQSDMIVAGPTNGGGKTVTVSGTGTNALDYDFRAGKYLVSYNCAYDYFDSKDIRQRTWPSSTFTVVGSGKTSTWPYKTGSRTTELENNGIGDLIQCYFGVTSESSNYCRVYYNEITEDEDFYLDVRIKKSNLNDTDVSWYLDKYTENGVKKYFVKTYPGDATEYIAVTHKVSKAGEADAYYPVRIINKCAVVDTTKNGAGAGLDSYPGAAAKTRSYNYPANRADEVLHAGFTYVDEDANGVYYLYTPPTEGEPEGGAYGSEPYVYLVLKDDPDRFLQGAYVSVGRGSTTQEGAQAYQFMRDYMASHREGEEGTRYELDPSATAVYVTNASYGGTYVSGTSGYLTYTYGYQGDCQLRYYYNGNTCYDNSHLYVYGRTVSKEQVYDTTRCHHGIGATPDGYEMVWYMDSDFQTPIPDEGIEMNRSITIYGQFEKSVVHNMEYIYYELADPITVGGVEQEYVTKENLDGIKTALAAKGESLDKSEDEVDVNIGGQTKKAKITVYSYDGAVVMVAKERLTLAFTELHLSMTEQNQDYEEAYGKEGFYYDETNTDNRSYGYVNYTPLDLKVYFARDKYQVQVIQNVSETDNPEFLQFSIGQHVDLEEPVKPGYRFDGWAWKDAANGSTYVPSYEVGETKFKMPAKDLVASAIWVADTFDNDVMHYFQTSDHHYETTFVSGIGGTEDTSKTAKWGAAEYSTGVKVYTDAGDKVTAVVIETADATYYFDGGKIQGDEVLVEEVNLVAAKTQIAVESESAQAADEGALDGFTLFQYSYTSVKTDKSVVTKKTGETYTAEYGMTLEYYYTRSADQEIRIRTIGLDDGAVGMTVTGEGECFLGDYVTVTAYLQDGYSFVGWYDASDLLKDYPGENSSKALSEYELVEGYKDLIEADSVTKLSAETAYAFDVTGKADLIAVSLASEVVEPDLVINGKTKYVYGYEASSDNMLIAVASMKSADPDANKTKVTDYHWYIKVGDEWVEPDDNNQSTLTIPTGLTAGTYTYKCVVSFERTDNGRTGTKEVEQAIVVSPAPMSVTATGYEGIFDNQNHQIHVNVARPDDAEKYEIYYSTTPITAENFDSVAKSTENPEFLDVNFDESGACPYTVYFYIKDKSGNYKDYTGSKDVNIKPKQISIKVLNSSFNKMYDASDVILGTPIEENTDMFRLAHGKGTLYLISGFVDGDDHADTYLLGSDASYDSAHVNGARSVTIRNLRLVSPSDGIRTYNYTFPDATELTFSGHITPRPLSVAWDTHTTFMYNGEPQAPDIRLAETQQYPIPAADDGFFELKVSGSQTNIGHYTATANAYVDEGGTFEPSDYTFDDMSREYDIVSRGITIKPITKTVTYDGTVHDIPQTTSGPGGTVKNYKIYLTGTDPLVEDHVVENFFLTMESVGSHVDANETGYQDMNFTGAVITNAQGRDLTENYTITYEPGTLIINRAEVIVSGVTAEKKFYDGTTSVVIHAGDDEAPLTFTPLYSQNGVEDVLTIDASKITAAYDAANVGTTKVNLSWSQDALTGPSAGNYVLDLDNCQDEATGLIRTASVKVIPDPKTVVYGESVEFTSSFDGIFASDGSAGTIEDITVDGSLTYRIYLGTDEERADPAKWVPYTPGVVGVGTYPIMVNTSSFTSSDHMFVYEKDDTSVLTVTARPVALKAVADKTVTKEYDRTTTVLEAVNKGSHYLFDKTKNDGGEDVEASGILDKDLASVDLSSKSVAYDSKNVTAQYVKLTDAALNDENYVLENDSVDITGEITPVDLTLTADDVEITYGDQKSEDSCSVTGSGFVSYTQKVEGVDTPKTEGLSDLPATLSYEFKTYDPAVQSKRNVGVYSGDIVPVLTLAGGEKVADNSICGNYTVHFVEGTLTVNKATMTITADDQELFYKVGGNSNGCPLGTVPDYTYTLGEWKYTEDEADYDLTGINLPQTEDGIVGAPSIGVLTVPGTYDIRIVVDNETDMNVQGITLNSARDNYEFKAAFGTLTVVKHLLSVNGTLTIPDKVYDGNNVVIMPEGETLGGLDDLVYDELATEDIPGKGVKVEFKADLNTYPGKDVNTYDFDSDGWTLTIELNDYLDARYQLDSEHTLVKASSSITKRDVQVKAKDKTIAYGSTAPTTYGIEEVKFVDGEGNPVADKNLVAKESLTTAYGFVLPTSYTCAYSDVPGAYSEVGTYAVTPDSVSAGNYKVIILSTGELTVTKTNLSTPSPVWDSANPGTITWEGVPSIGDVSCGGYELELYKDDEVTPVASESVAGTVSSFDFDDAIHTAGGGVYTVKVKAVASTENNAGKKNVDDSSFGTSGTLYATTVTAEFAGRLDGAGDQIGDVDPIYLADTLGSYTLIAGETAVDVSAVLKNATGYSAVVSGDSTLTITQGTISAGPSGSGSFGGATVAVAADATPAAATTLVITLAANKATLTGSFAEKYVEEGQTYLVYGYGPSAAPTLTATVAPESTDNVDADGYTYQYEWKIRFGNVGEYETVKLGSENTLLFPYLDPSGKLMTANIRYNVRCSVIATRKDNGETITISALEDSLTGVKYAVIPVRRGSYNPTLTFGISGDNWTYGDSRKLPDINGRTDEELLAAPVTYQFCITNSENNADWSTEMFTDAGTYYVRAVISETTNYESKTTPAIAYTVNQAKLGTPQNLTMDKSDTAPFGLYKWDEVVGPKENNGATGNTDSEIQVKYHVELYMKDDGGNIDVIKTVDISDHQYDFTDMIVEEGTYGVSVTAIVDESRIGQAYVGQDINNCAASDPVSIISHITIGAKMESNNPAGKDNFSKVYDGTPLVMKVIYEDGSGTPTYKWMKNGHEIAGATEDTYAITYVEESGTFTCEVTSANGSIVYTKAVPASITPRPITVTTASEEKTYDGTALTNSNYTISYTGDAAKAGIVDNDAEAISVNGTITYVTENASGNNTYTGLTITRTTGAGSKVVYTEGGTNNNYTVTAAYGTLSILQRQLTITATAKTDYEYDGTAKTSTAYTQTGLQGTDVIKDASLVFGGNITNAGTVTNTPSAAADAVVVTAADTTTDLTANYDIRFVGADLTVNPRPITIQTGTDTKVYDGLPLTKDTYNITSTKTLVAGETIDSIVIDGTQTNVGTSDNTVASIVIKKANGDLSTDNYDITVDKGTLTVTKADRVINAEDVVLAYNGENQTITATIDSANPAVDDVDLQIKVHGTDTDFTGATERGKYEIDVIAPATDNYNSATKKVTMTIKRHITVIANTNNKDYDGTALTDSGYQVVFSDGTLQGDALADTDEIDVTVTGSITNKGTTPNVPSGAVVTLKETPYTDVSEFYVVSYVNGLLSIDQKTIQLIANSTEKTYDGTALTLGAFTHSGEATGDVITLSMTADSTITNAGSVDNVIDETTIAVTDAGGNDVTGNYTFSCEKGTLTVNRKALTISAVAKEYDYDGTEKTFYGAGAFTVSGLENGDVVDPDGLKFSGKITDAGTVTNTPSRDGSKPVVKNAAGTLDMTNNYDIQYYGADLTVKPVPITVTTQAETKVYDGTALTRNAYEDISVTAGTLQNGDTIDAATLVISGSQTNVGRSNNTIGTLKIVKTNGDDATSNYVITEDLGELVVTKATRVITADDLTVSYDGTVKTVPASINKATEADDVALEYTSGGLPFTGAVERGAYVVTITAPATDNYLADSKTVTLTIVRDITVKADSDRKIYDGIPLTAPGYTIHFTNTDLTGDALADGDEVTAISVVGSQLENGSSPNVVSGAVIENSGTDVTEFYNITYENGLLNVGKLPLKITADDATRAYNGAPLTCGTFTTEGLWEGDVVELSMTGASTITYVGTTPNVIDQTTVVVKSSLGVNVNEDYDFSYVDGLLEVTKQPLTVTATEKTYTYDGEEHTSTAYTQTGLQGTDCLDETELVFDGRIKNAGEVDNMPSGIKVLNAAGDMDVSDNYEISHESAKLIVEPKMLVDDDLTLDETAYAYDGQTHGPAISVKVDLNLDGVRETTPVKGSDYTITDDADSLKAVEASKVGTYTVEVVGQGNYTGTVSKTFAITDEVSATINNEEGNLIANGDSFIYCKEFVFDVADPNFADVTVYANGEDVTAQVLIERSEGTGTEKHYVIKGVGDDPDVPTDYTIKVRDVKNRVDGTVIYNVQTFDVKLYPDHTFTNYQVDHTKTPDGFVYEADCDHNCGAQDYVVKAQGSVRWHYEYSYDTPDGLQEGTQNKKERETYAIVRLIRNGEVVAEKLVNCDSECGANGSKDTAEASYMIDKATDGTLLPYADADGNPYSYELSVSPVHYNKDANTYRIIDTYSVEVEDHSLTTNKVNITYTPGIFDVPWKVVLKNLPKAEDGSVIHPSAVHVKVLYADTPDAEDNEYQVITQQVAPGNHGEACVAQQEDGTFVYYGSYPCWEFIGGRKDSYYYRIQVVGYDFDGQYYDVSADDYRSICDEDHVNHTIGFDDTTGKATGTILYELEGLMPSLVFMMNDGTDAVYDTIWKGIGAFGGTTSVSAEEIKEIGKPTRNGYTFVGWFTEPEGGTQVTGPVTLTKTAMKVYAQWKKVSKYEPDKPSDDDGGNSGGGTTPGTNPGTGGGTTPGKPDGGDGNNPGTNPGRPGNGGGTNPGTEPGVNDGTSPDDTTGVIDDTPGTGEPEQILPDKDGGNKGKVEVIVEHGSDNVDEDKPNPETGKTPGKGPDIDDPVRAELPHPEKVAEDNLTEEEKALVEDGGNIIIRLLVDEEEPELDEEGNVLGEQNLLNQLSDKSKHEVAVLDRYIKLKLEKKINDGDWERILKSGGKVEVVINLPSGVLGAKRFVLAKPDGNGGYIILEDLDDNPNTMTIMVDDFDSDYALIRIEDEMEICYWHYLILLITLIYLIALLIMLKKKKREEDEENQEIVVASAEEEEENPLVKKAKKSRNRRWISMIPYAIVLIVATYFGFCKWEIPFDVISVILVSGTEYGTYKHKFKELKDEKEEQKQGME